MDDGGADDVDYMLASLYRAVAVDIGGELSVTLLVGGSWLSGSAISGRVWTRLVAHKAKEAGADAFVYAFEHIGQALYPAESEVEPGVAEPPGDDRPIGYIHLRDARLWRGGEALPTEGGLVRCRLDQVAAWVLGGLGPPGYAPPPPPV